MTDKENIKRVLVKVKDVAPDELDAALDQALDALLGNVADQAPQTGKTTAVHPASPKPAPVKRRGKKKSEK